MLFDFPIDYLCYGDAAYPLLRFITRGVKRRYANPQDMVNSEKMSKVRVWHALDPSSRIPDLGPGTRTLRTRAHNTHHIVLTPQNHIVLLSPGFQSRNHAL
jgi:hypothetical protein